MRIGHGYDVHRLAENRRLVLCGVEIPFEKGLLGHSDADVLLHAITDALFGAAAAAATFQTSMVRSLSKLGFLLLFAGGYLLLDTITISFVSETQVFNTYARQICMMFAVHWLGLSVRDILTGPRLRIAKAVLGISFALNIVLILPSFTGAWAIYSTLPAWILGQIVFTAVLLGAVVWELLKGAKQSILDLLR